jgi:hypothetical protein
VYFPLKELKQRKPQPVPFCFDSCAAALILKMIWHPRQGEGNHAAMEAAFHEWRYSWKSIGILRRRGIIVKLLK